MVELYLEAGVVALGAAKLPQKTNESRLRNAVAVVDVAVQDVRHLSAGDPPLRA